jgi:hypothetical protein
MLPIKLFEIFLLLFMWNALTWQVLNVFWKSGCYNIEDSAGTKGVVTSQSDACFRHDAAHQSPRLEPTDHLKASPQSPKSFGLGVIGPHQPGEGSSVPSSGKHPCQHSYVAESLWDNLNFIQAGFHIGQYVTASMNTKAGVDQGAVLQHEDHLRASWCEHLSVLKFDSSSIQAMAEHSQDKDQFLKVSIKWMQDSQTFEDGLNEANKHNVFFARLQELAVKWAEESQLIDGKFLLTFYLGNLVISEYTLDWSWPCLTEYKDQLMALGIIPGAPNSETKAFADLKEDLDEEKATRIMAQIEVDILSWAARDLKISTHKFATQIPTLEDKVKHLENKVVDGLNEIQAWELCLECTTQVNDDYLK